MRPRQRRCRGNQRGGECIQQPGFALRVDAYFAGEILHRAAQAVLLRQVEHERTVTHTLHPSTHHPAPGYDVGAACGMWTFGIHPRIVPLSGTNIKDGRIPPMLTLPR